MKILQNLKFLFMPNYWVMLDKYSQEWDEKLNNLLDNYQFVFKDTYTSMLGDHELWIENYPYRCFAPVRRPTTGKPKLSLTENIRASRLTILRARKQLLADTKSETRSF